MQKSDWHWVFDVQLLPGAWSGMQWWLTVSQKLLAMHSESSLQVLPQVAPVPVHRYGEHEGAPSTAFSKSLHVPGTELQVSHAPAQAVSQQKPSTQLPPVLHSRHPASVQSVTRLQAWPWAFCGWQVPPAAQ